MALVTRPPARIDLEALLPTVVRLRDLERERPLGRLLGLIGEQAEIVKENVVELWDDFFVETCADWVVPYIADLVGTDPLPGAARRRRADVAKTIGYRRRKGTLPMLEELARDVTGWPAHAVALFERVGWTQNLDHVRPGIGTAAIRDLEACDRVDGPFDGFAHTADVRPLSRVAGRENLGKVGFYLWRLRSYPLLRVEPRPLSGTPHRLHFSPLGNPAPLFRNAEREIHPFALSDERDVPDPIRRTAFHFHRGDLYGDVAATAQGPNPSLGVYTGTTPSDAELLPIEDIRCRDLSGWEPPPAGKVAIDARLGRLAFAAGEEPDYVAVSYHYGFAADVGGGPYTRADEAPTHRDDLWEREVARDGTADFESIVDALDEWATAGRPDAVVRILDSSTYDGDLEVEPADTRGLVLEAASGQRPVVLGSVTVTAPTGGSPDAALTLAGFAVEGAVVLGAESLGRLRLVDCTLVPGRALDEEGTPQDLDAPSISATAPNDRLRIEVVRAIVGRLIVPAETAGLTVADSVVDAGAGSGRAAIAATPGGLRPGPATTIERSTVFGAVRVRELALASQVLFTDRVVSERRQAGCVRFSFVPDGSRTPRRYRCQPDLALEDEPGASAARLSAELQPSFTSVHFGDPGYARLSLATAEAIRTGAEDGSEMGIFGSLAEPLREASLRLRLDEYLPFGLDAGPIYIT